MKHKFLIKAQKQAMTFFQSLVKRRYNLTLDSIFNHFPTRGNSQTQSMVTWVLKLGNLDEAERFMRTHIEKTQTLPTTRLWGPLIREYCTDSSDPDDELQVLRDCLNSRGNFLPSSSSFCSLIHRFCSKGDMRKAVEVLELMSEFEYPFDNFVCSSVMAGLCRIGEAKFAVRLFESAVSSGGLKANVVTYTALVGGLCGSGRVSEVRGLVSRMMREGIEPDVVFYNSWICGYISGGSLNEMLKLNRKMERLGIVSDTISYTILIDGFSKLGDVEKSVGFVEKMRREGLEPNLITFTSILLGFCRKGKIKEAISVFEMVLELGFELDEFIYATLIYGLCRVGDFNRVFQLLDEMETRRISPTLVTYNTVINGLCKFGRTNEANEISKGISGDSITYTTLLHGYVKEENLTGILETKRRLEEAGVRVDVVMSNVLIKALFMIGAINDACELYKEMRDESLTANSVMFCGMIHGYCKVGRVNEAIEVFDDFRRSRISSVACYNCLLTGLCNNNMVDMAIEVFIELIKNDFPLDLRICRTLINLVIEQNGPESSINLLQRLENETPDVFDILCNITVGLLSKRSYLETPLQVVMMMRTRGLTLTSASYYQVIKSLVTGGNKLSSFALLNCFLKDYGLLEPRVRKILSFYWFLNDVDIALKFITRMKDSYGTIKLPRSVFKEMIKYGRVLDVYKLYMKAEEDSLPRTAVTDYTYVIHDLCKRGFITEALDLIGVAQGKGVSLNIVVYNVVIGGLCLHGRLIEAFRVFDSLERLNLVPSKVTYSVLVHALCRERFLSDAEELFKKMIFKGCEPNIRLYNSLIDCYCKTGRMEEAVMLLDDSESKGLKPDGFTVGALINGCCYSGNMERALEYYSEFKKKSILPDFLGFMFLIRGLYSKGRMEESRTVIRDMLHCESIVEMINRVDTGGESETLESFLVSLCDQGRVKDAVMVLNEVVSLLYPRRTCKPDLDRGLRGDRVEETRDGSVEKRRFRGFHDYYSRVASLCSSGEIEKAGELAKELLLGSD